MIVCLYNNRNYKQYISNNNNSDSFLTYSKLAKTIMSFVAEVIPPAFWIILYSRFS